jgi:hypothetical protein
VASILNAFCNGASLLANAFGVGFIDWLDAGLTTTKKLRTIICSTLIFKSRLLDTPLSMPFTDMEAIIDVPTMFIATRDHLCPIILHDPHAEIGLRISGCRATNASIAWMSAREIPRNQAYAVTSYGDDCSVFPGKDSTSVSPRDPSTAQPARNSAAVSSRIARGGCI